MSLQMTFYSTLNDGQEFDGACRGNPGRAGLGAVLREPGTGAEVATVCRSLPRATNNIAEYGSLLIGLQVGV